MHVGEIPQSAAVIAKLYPAADTRRRWLPHRDGPSNRRQDACSSRSEDVGRVVVVMTVCHLGKAPPVGALRLDDRGPRVNRKNKLTGHEMPALHYPSANWLAVMIRASRAEP